MKRHYLAFVLSAAVTLPAVAANWYVKPAGGTGSGADWNNAWSITKLNSTWASVSPGDTVWLAGGTYTVGISFTKSGTVSNYIYCKGVLASDSVPASAAGWQSSFACDVTRILITPGSGGTPLDFAANYIYVDGRTNNIDTTTIDQRRNNLLYTGMKAAYDNTADAFLGAVVFNTSGVHDCVVMNVEGCGPGTGTYASPVNFNYQGDNAALQLRVTGSGTLSNLLVSHCIFHSSPNLVRNEADGVKFITIDHCVFYDSSSSNSNIHENLCYHVGGSYWTFRYCDFTGWQIEGIILFEVGHDNAPHWVYGNIFHDPVDSGATCFWPGSNSGSSDTQGPLYLYNNTFVGCTITSGQSRSYDFSASSVSKNNIFWNSTFDSASDFSAATEDYNYSSGSTAGVHSISSGTAPFVDLTGRDYHIVSTVSAAKPKDKGVQLSNVSGSPGTTTFSADMDGNTRGADGNWDIGTYEYSTGVGIAPTITVQPQNQSVTVGQTATFTVTATGDPTLHYAWTFNGGSVGSDSSSYARSNCQLADSGGSVAVTVSNASGSANSSTATLTVTASSSVTKSYGSARLGVGSY